MDMRAGVGHGVICLSGNSPVSKQNRAQACD